METRAHHILIGLFTVVVVAGAMWFILWLSKSGPSEDSAVYDIIFRESVTGLSMGSRVLYSGIHVGAVKRIQIDPDNPRQVVARIQVADTTPVNQDTRAELILANITGASEIQLFGGSNDSPPLESDDETVPRIVADPSRLARLSETAAELLKDLSTLIEKGNLVLSEENTTNLSNSLHNINALTGILADQDDGVKNGMQKLSRLSREVEQLLNKFHALVDNQGETLMSNGVRTSASLQRSTAKLEQMLDENEEAFADGIEGLRDIGPALDELRSTMATLSEVVRRFDRDPGSYLFNREPVREFQP
ncbi:MAG: MlaD family protein [Pseudomonadota bacterium]